ncbi:AbrB family transcriptional regulator [Loktanella sp. IMCC34160]|uniref:AbrB family transcriptional regulator n=1 Tax=Loktanella sp. IMCC34160 TaxID=2510646 RepID=UPI00101B86D3|nr:AbrB family transcriptional regulator [Loktanella sp. IMCC34160]RYG91499.1 AbrB family transcriptional regulator [Loktanella sp. IMCC34160]
MTSAPRIVLALMVGAAAGWTANRLGLPLPWMLGPMIANTLLSILKAPVAAPAGLRPFVIPVIGVLLGSTISAEILGRLGEWALTVAVMLPFLAVAAAGSYFVYRRIGGYDPVTAYFSAMPGGLNEMLIMGAASGGVEKRIALAHASRILVVISFVGLFYGLVLDVRSSSGAARGWVALSTLSPQDWAWLGGCALVGIPVGRFLRLPAPVMLGPMLLSGIAHLLHLVEVAPPSLLVIAAQIVLGTVIGCRFLGASAREIGRDIWLGVWSSSAMLLVAVGFAFLTASLTDTPVAQVFLAYSPGGLTEMSLLALAMGQDVAYVSIMHLLRILIVIVAAPAVFRRR